jgi:PAS domain S-box-containing protein
MDDGISLRHLFIPALPSRHFALALPAAIGYLHHCRALISHPWWTARPGHRRADLNAQLEASDSFPSGGGASGELMRKHDWSLSPLGPPSGWPAMLRASVALILDSGFAMCIAWGDELALLYNDNYAAMLGDKHPAALGRPAQEIWADIWPGIEPLVERALSGQLVHFADQKLLLERNGQSAHAWFTFSYSPIRDENGRICGIYCVSTETTATVLNHKRQSVRIAYEDRLRYAASPEAIMQLTAELLGPHLRASRAGIVETEDDGNTLVFHRDWTDGKARSLAGMRFSMSDFREELLGELRAGCTVVTTDAQQYGFTGGPDGGPYANIHARAGITVPLIRNGQFSAALYVHSTTPRQWREDERILVREIAERAWDAIKRSRAEQKMQELNAVLEAGIRQRTRERDRLWRMSQDLMAVASLKGYIRAVNPAFTATLGWNEDEATSVPFLELAHPDDRAELVDKLGILREGRPVVRYEIRTLHKDGGFRWLSWNVVPEGELLYGVARDITVERRQAEALRQTEEALRQAQKMEAVGQLTGGIAHDFNNLLATMVANLDVMKMKMAMGDTAGLERYVDGALGVANRASALTHRLLAFSRRQTLAPKPVDVNRLVASMADMIVRAVGPSVELATDFDDGIWMTRCDPNQLESALLNLAINARDAMPAGGRLAIETRNVGIDDAAANLSGIAPGDYVEICVIDNGTGMPPEVAARAFDPFFTTKPQGQGTGLGLSMIYGFVTQSGGHVGIASVPGKGTAVSIKLPRTLLQEIPREAAPAAEGASAVRAWGELLLVEDDAPLRGVLGELLSLLGYRVLPAAEAAEALQIVESHPGIEMLITDIGLPGSMNGRQLAAKVQELRPGLKTLLITGYIDSDTSRNVTTAPGMQVMTKPFTLDAFAARIRDMLGDGMAASRDTVQQ